MLLEVPGEVSTKSVSTLCSSLYLDYTKAITKDDFSIPSGKANRCGLHPVNSSILSKGVLVQGSNTIQINVISGSSGDSFLSPNFVFDSVELF